MAGDETTLLYIIVVYIGIVVNKKKRGETDVRDLHGRIGIYREIAGAMPHAACCAPEDLSVAHLLSRRYGALPHGGRKRVLIVRAPVNDTELLMLDEPAGGLDSPAREVLLAVVDHLTLIGLTLIRATHHVEEILPSFNRAHIMENGTVVASGDRSEGLTERLPKEAPGYDLSLVENGVRLWPRHFQGPAARIQGSAVSRGPCRSCR